MAFEVRLERSDRIAIITIDNPPVNALHPDVADAIAEKAAIVATDRGSRAVILTGAGKHFMAGGDIEFFKTLNRSSAERYVLGVQKMQDDLATLPQPVIAALNGTTLGGGCELAMACDIRIAEEQVMLGQPEVSLGLIPGAGGTQALPRLVPLGRAKRMLFTGERITAQEGLAIGLGRRSRPHRDGAGAGRRACARDRSERAARGYGGETSRYVGHADEHPRCKPARGHAVRVCLQKPD